MRDAALDRGTSAAGAVVGNQRQFHAADWGTDLIDEVYLDGNEDGFCEEQLGGGGCPWNGLRVRVGMHYGTGEIKLDPVSGGYGQAGPLRMGGANAVVDR